MPIRIRTAIRALCASLVLVACATEKEAGPRAPLQFATAPVKTAPDAYAQSQVIDIESHARGSVYRKRVKTAVKSVDFDETAPGDLKEYGYHLDDLKDRGSDVKRAYQVAARRLRDLAQRERLRFRLNPNRTQFVNFALSQELGQVKLGTVQLYFAQSAHQSPRSQSSWWYHLGTLILDQGQEWVIDFTPGALARPVLLHDWLRSWSKGADCAEITHEHEGFFEAMRTGTRFPGVGYGGFADCYYRRAPMQYWTPRSLAAWDLRSAQARTDFDLAELTQSCADGTVSTTRAAIPWNQRKDSCRIYLSRIRPAEPTVTPPPRLVAPAPVPAPAAPAPETESPPSEDEGDLEL